MIRRRLLRFGCFHFAVIVTLAVAQFSANGLLGQTASQNAAKPRPTEPDFSWRQTETSIALLNHGRIVWQHVHDRKVGKPYMRIGMTDGTELTRPWPIPQGYPKADHTWHRALWWSWKAIDGVNYWEENQEGTEPVAVKVRRKKDGSARINTIIAYHLPQQPPVVIEKRVITVGAPDATGTYLIDWRATFKPAGEKDVVLNRNSYTGLAIRMAAEFCGDAAGGRPAWTFFDSQDQANSNGKRARWVAYRGTAPNGQPAAIAIFDHPDNLRHPTWWQTRSQYPYLNPSFACREDYALAAGKSLTLRYGILVHHGPADKEELQQRWISFAGLPGRK